MATLEEHICGLKDRLGVMQRLILGMAQEIDTLSEELGHEGQNTMAVTELTLPIQETGLESDRLASDDEQQSGASSKRLQNESSNQQRIPLFRFTVMHSQAPTVVATRLDAKQLLEAEIQKATQESAQGQAEGRFVIRNGCRYPINKRNGFVSDWSMGHSGCFLCENDHRFEYCNQRNDQGNFGVHRPEYKRVKRMEEPTDCVKQIY
eukprot:scaffold293043_cov71-Attheya_sp.AAC.5